MRAWVRILGGVAVVVLGAACTPSPAVPSHSSTDGGQSGCRAPSTACAGGCCPGGTECVDGRCAYPCPHGTRCENQCCPEGTQCVSGECHYPYSTAHLYVWLCPGFHEGCTQNFFQLDKMCSPVGPDGVGGTCYDTGLEVSANQHYGLTTCESCGTNCAGPSSLNTPAGFVTADWYSGFAYWCNEDCEAPPSCGGKSTSNSGANGGTSTGPSGGNGGTTQVGGSADGGISAALDGGTDAAMSSSGPGVCATSAAGKCVKCSGPGDSVCGAETCCGFDNLSFCTDIGLAACIMCMTDKDCDPGVPCCH